MYVYSRLSNNEGHCVDSNNGASDHMCICSKTIKTESCSQEKDIKRVRSLDRVNSKRQPGPKNIETWTELPVRLIDSINEENFKRNLLSRREKKLK